MLLISDIHGCYHTLRRLLRRCPDEAVVFLGDLTDRGPNSKEVVQFAMEEKIPTVMGNHEDLLLHAHGRASVGYEKGLWEFNGGMTTLRSFGVEVMPADVLDWIGALPLLLRYGNLVLSHTGHGDSRDRMTALWARSDEAALPADGTFRVFGHTPSKFCLLGERWARVDTGAAYKDKGYGVLSALQWPQMRVFSQPYDESSLEPVVTVEEAA